MTEPIEGKPAEGEQVAKPVSSEAPAQPSAVELAKVIQDLQKANAIHEAELRALKSAKDRRWDTEVTPMKDAVARLAEAMGVDISQVKSAQRKIALEDLADTYLDELAGDESQGESPLAGTGAETSNLAELQTIEAALELPANDSRVTDLKIKYGNDVAKFALEGAKLKNELATAQPTPGEQPLPSGGPKAERPETDEQKRARIFGSPAGIFDEQFAREHGGGVFIRK